MTPRVSVVTCTYNREDLIGETIQSIIDQTFSDFEYVIIDEGDDNTEKVVRSFIDRRVLYFKVPNTKGHQSKLRNLALSKCRGEYIAFVDSDDIWLPEKLQQQMEGMEKNQTLGFSYTDVLFFNRMGVIRNSLYNKLGVFSGSVFEDFIRNKFVICTTTLLFRKSCLNTVGGWDERFKYGDFDFLMSLAARFEAFVVFSPLVRVRKHDHNVSRRLPLEKAEGFLTTYNRMVAEGFVSSKSVKRTLSRLCYSLGIEFGRQGDFKEAVVFFRRSLAYDLLFWKAGVRWLGAKLNRLL
jgi:glycosyltransferase involved in cell wall biosynthesis